MIIHFRLQRLGEYFFEKIKTRPRAKMYQENVFIQIATGGLLPETRC